MTLRRGQPRAVVTAYGSGGAVNNLAVGRYVLHGVAPHKPLVVDEPVVETEQSLLVLADRALGQVSPVNKPLHETQDILTLNHQARFVFSVAPLAEVLEL